MNCFCLEKLNYYCLMPWQKWHKIFDEHLAFMQHLIINCIVQVSSVICVPYVCICCYAAVRSELFFFMMLHTLSF